METGHPHPPRPAWLEIDCGALAHNTRLLRARLAPACTLMAVVKANGYGHGALTAARTALANGAGACAVATLGEALELRAGGVAAPVLVLGYTPPWQAAQAAAQGVTLTVYDAETARGYAKALEDTRLSVHVKVNTGMNRLGVEPGEAEALLVALREMAPLRVEGIYTHFATSDESDKSHSRAQFASFTEVLRALEAAGLRPPLAHAANSAALLTMPETHLDMVRAGIALYGLDPDDEQCALPPEFRPALRWKALVAQVRRLAPGDAVSYGREFVAERPTLAAVIPVGYADGFPRKPRTWGYVLVGGRPAPILGRVCMDQTVVDVTAHAEAGTPVRQGDEAVIIGSQGGARICAEDAAARVGTNNYDMVSRILARVPRVIVNEAGDGG
jgi:alanine racemase